MRYITGHGHGIKHSQSLNETQDQSTKSSTPLANKSMCWLINDFFASVHVQLQNNLKAPSRTLVSSAWDNVNVHEHDQWRVTFKLDFLQPHLHVKPPLPSTPITKNICHKISINSASTQMTIYPPSHYPVYFFSSVTGPYIKACPVNVVSRALPTFFTYIITISPTSFWIRLSHMSKWGEENLT